MVDRRSGHAHAAREQRASCSWWVVHPEVEHLARSLLRLELVVVVVVVDERRLCGEIVNKGPP